MPLHISPATFTGLGVLIGYVLSNELTPIEQAAVGSWLNLVGDVLATNAGWIGVIEERQSVFEKQNDTSQEESHVDNMEVIYKAISKIKKEIEALQKNEFNKEDV